MQHLVLSFYMDQLELVFQMLLSALQHCIRITNKITCYYYSIKYILGCFLTGAQVPQWIPIHGIIYHLKLHSYNITGGNIYDILVHVYIY